jgi:tRNA nucleotidyltransferase (CCA-adding enzyme)
MLVRREDLERAHAWGLGGLPVSLLAEQGVPVVPAALPETAVRRHVVAGARLVLVSRGRQVTGVVEAARLGMAPPALSLAAGIEHPTDPEGEARLWLLRLAGKLGEALDQPVWAVGGFVRDLLLGRPALDVDLVVEGDGPALARRLAEEAGGRLTVHRAFGTAVVEEARAPNGLTLPRVDVASARREHYPRPGALPRVEPASLVEDLARRDFAANALALGLGPGPFGRLVDPYGGSADLRGRWLRPLGPLSFVEDPTRVFRAARYAARLGWRLHPAGRRALRLALAVGRYPALSGQRLRAEVELCLEEPSGWQALGLLGRWGAWALLDAGYRQDPATGRRLGQARRLLAVARQGGVALPATHVALSALLLDQRPRVASRCVARLALTGRAGGALVSGRARGAALGRRLGAAGVAPSQAARLLARPGAAEVTVAWLTGGPLARRWIRWFWRRGRLVRPALRGEDLVRLGVEPGPAVGRALGRLRALRLDGRIGTREEEEHLVRRWGARPQGGGR